MDPDRLKSAFEVSGLGMWEWDLADDAITISDWSHALLGYAPGELPRHGDAWRDLLHPDDRGRAEEALERIRRHEDEVIDIEARFAAKTGQWRWLRCRGQVVQRSAHGAPLRVVGSHVDLTPAKEIENALRESEERYRSLVESQGEGIGIVDQEEQFIFANLAAERIFGVRPGKMVGRNLKEFVAPQEFQRVLEQTGRRRGGNRDTYEMAFTRTDGQRRVLLVTATPRVDGAGAYSGAFGVFRDITERKQAEEALRESEERYRQLIESLPHGVGVIQRGQVLFANRAAAQILGLDSTERLQDMSPVEPLVEAERQRVRQLVLRLLRGEITGPLHYFTHARHSDGTEVPLEVFVSSAPLRGEPAAQVFFMDISGRLDAEQERRVLQEQLLQSRKLESLGRLAGGIAHEFNNLLTPVIINTSMALQDMAPADPRREDLDDVLEAATRAKELTRQLLAFSRQQLLQVQDIDINALIERWHEVLRRVLRDDVVVHLDLTDALDGVTARVDPGQLQQVLVKLALNACESMPEGGTIRIGTAARRVEPAVDSELGPGRYVEISVSDDGRGMDRATVSHVFDPFYSTKDPALGAGLGLASVHGIIKQHGGDIEVESEPGKGSVFRVLLPAAQPQDPEAREQERPTLLRDAAGLTVLVVEDEDLLRRQICRILRRHDAQVLEATDGLRAIEVSDAHGGPIHVLLTDVVMPRLGGRELARRLRQSRPEIRVIFMSGYTEELVGDRPGEDAALLEKPFTLQTLVEKLQEVLDG